jgi:serine/threonine-protein kinase
MYWIRSDGAGEIQRLTEDGLYYPYSFTPDGKRLCFNRTVQARAPDLYTAAIEGDLDHPKLGTPEAFLATPFVEAYGMFSPDGRWVAYMSQESGANEIYVRPFPGPGGRWQISTAGGNLPVWSPHRNELLFQGLDDRVMVVSYTAKNGSFIADKPRAWSEKPVLNHGTFSMWDIAPDGKRPAAILPEQTQQNPRPQTHVTFLLNFADELQRRTPRDN